MASNKRINMFIVPIDPYDLEYCNKYLTEGKHQITCGNF